MLQCNVMSMGIALLTWAFFFAKFDIRSHEEDGRMQGYIHLAYTQSGIVSLENWMHLCWTNATDARLRMLISPNQFTIKWRIS